MQDTPGGRVGGARQQPTAFVGRADELEHLESALERARAGDPHVVLVEGAPGIGKTALLQHFLAQHPDLLVVWASGDETEAALEYGVLDQLRAACAPGPTAATAPSRGAVGRAVERDSLSAGAELLECIGGLEDRATAVVAVVDDLHWSDVSSARAVLFFLRRLRADNVLVLLAARPRSLDSLGESWGRFLADPARVQRVGLPGLTEQDVRALAAAAGQVLPSDASARLREHTGGNPLFVGALLEELPAAALLGAAPLPAPHSYATTILTRLAGASSPARDLVAAAAVLGARHPLRTVATVAGVEDAFAVADEAGALGLLERVPGGDVVEVVFRHPLVRAAVYDDLSPERRRALHLAAAEQLDGAAALAHRVAGAAGFDAGLAVELADVAQAELVAGAFHAAVEHLEQSARLDPWRPAAEARLLEAVELHLIGGEVHAARALRPAVDRCADTAHRRYVEAALTAAAGRLPDAAAALHAVVAETAGADATSGERGVHGRAAAALAIVGTTLGDESTAEEYAREALATPETPVLSAGVARQSLAMSLAKSGRREEAIGLLADVIPAPGTPQAFGTDLLSTRAMIRLWGGDAAGAAADLGLVVRRSQAGHPPSTVSGAYTVLAHAEVALGAWDDALVHLDLAVGLAHDLEHHWQLAYTHVLATALDAARGRWDSAQEHVAAAEGAVEIVPAPHSVAHARVAAATLAWARGDAEGVRAALAPLQAGAQRAPVDAPVVAGWRWLLADALLTQGDTAGAVRLLDEAQSRHVASEQDAVEVARVRARALGASGASEASRTAALALLDRPGLAPYPRALTALELGRLLASTGRAAEAVPHVRAARASAAALGAAPLVAACDAQLSAIEVPGARPPPDAHGGDVLTIREQAVARLVARGLTNREVAAELWVSPKTVEYHLAHIFAKLGVSSRRHLRAALATAPTPVR